MRKIIITGIVILTLIVTFLILARFVGTTGLKVKEYKVSSNLITDDYHGLKIVHISDLHFYSIVKEKEIKRIVEEINLIEPDIVVLTGDLIDDRIEYDRNILIKYLSEIKAPLGKYAVSGNHDLPVDDLYSILEETGFTNLDNTYKLIYNGKTPIIISGVSNEKVDTSEFDEYISSLDTKLFSILLLHRPDVVDKLNLDNYNLVLAGHSHNGQVNIPILKKIFMPIDANKYYDNYYKINNTDFYISSGLGTSGYRLRLFNKPSFNLYRITK